MGLARLFIGCYDMGFGEKGTPKVKKGGGVLIVVNGLPRRLRALSILPYPVGYLLAFLFSPSVRMGQPCAYGMLHVVPIGTPFEVAHMVVEFVAVDVVDARQVVRVRCECFDDQPMHLAAIRFVVHPEGHGIVAFALNGLRHNASNYTVVPFH